MRAPGFITGLILATVTATALANLSAEADLAPFLAHYRAEWKSISVGTSDLDLRRDGEAGPGRYIYTWRISAHGIFRLVYSHDVIQTSWFTATHGHIRPDKYRAEDGSSSVEVHFDWPHGRARGQAQSKPLDLKLEDGTQDVMSIQAEVMLGLRNGTLPKTFLIIDKDQPKEFLYTQEGSEKIATALGKIDTQVVTSQRAGGDRILRMWFAPSLGYVPVQAERTRNGKLEFAMRIMTLNR